MADIAGLFPKRLKAMYERIYNEIINFMTDPDENRAVLYFHWPTEELTNNPNQQIPKWRELCETCAMAMRQCLQLLGADQFGRGREGEQYFLLSEAEDGEFLYIPMNNDNGELRHRIRSIVNGHLTDGYIIGDRRQNAINALTSIFRVRTLYGQGMQFGTWLRNCRREIEILRYGNRCNWESAILYATDNLNESRIAGQYLYPAVDMSRTNIDMLPIRDIAAVIGDRAYESLGQRLRNQLAPYGPLHKLIVFASCANGLEGDMCKVVDFSFREAYDLLNHGRPLYNEPELLRIETEGFRPVEDLTNLYNMLNRALEDENVDRDALRHIYNVARAELCSINFSRASLEEFQKWFVNSIRANYPNIDPDLLGEIDDWADALEYAAESNPKNDYLRALRRQGGNVILIDKRRSIARQVNNLPNQNRRYTFVVDAPRHSAGASDNVISNLMRYHLFDRVVCLYYAGVEEHLFGRVQNELRRDKLFNAEAEMGPEEDRAFDLADYNDEPTATLRRGYYDNEGIRLTFADDTTCLVSGNVLVHREDGNLEQIAIAEMGEWEGRTITYYQNDDYFDVVVRAYLNLPDGHDINYYSQLWHDALNRYLNDNNNGRDTVCRLLGKEPNYLNRHLAGTSRFMSGRLMDILLNFLSEEGLISDEDRGNVMRAYNMMMREHTTFGVRFKDALLAYRLDPDAQISDFLNDIIGRLPQDETIDTLCDRFLFTNTIKTIE